MDPAELSILIYPAAALRQRAHDIEASAEVRAVAQRMVQLMFEADGIGLAAPQVGLPWRLFVAHVPADETRSADADPPSATAAPRVFINPILSAPGGELVGYEEGCLSLPDIRGDVLRPERITITALDVEGQTFSMTGAGLLARCLQHEFDHLEGILILDRMSQLSRLKNRSAVRKLERDHRL
jgi:peptide deformylase